MSRVKPTAADSPCVGCGLCCDGTLFSRAKVRLGEQKRLSALGFSFFPQGDADWFSQPCVAATEGRCAIYAARPHTCRAYSCALLDKVDAGGVPPIEARATIARAFVLIERAAAHHPEARNHASRKELRAALAAKLLGAPASERQAIANRLLAIIALDTFLDTHFRRPEGKADGDSPDADEPMPN